MLKLTPFVALLLFGMAGCNVAETLNPNRENFERQVVNCGRDTSFVIENKGVASSAAFHIEGDLSHDARLLWSYQPLDTLNPSSEIPTYAMKIALPAGKVNVSDEKDYYSKKLYVRYIPSNDSTSGNLTVKIKI